MLLTEDQQLEDGVNDTERVVLFNLSWQMMRRMLEFGGKVRVRGAWYSPSMRGWQILMESEDFDEVRIGEKTPLMHAIYSVEYCDKCGHGKVEVSFDN